MKNRKRSIKGYNLLWIWAARPGLIRPFWLRLQSDSAVLWCSCPNIAEAEHLSQPVPENCPYPQNRMRKQMFTSQLATLNAMTAFINLLFSYLQVPWWYMKTNWLQEKVKYFMRPLTSIVVDIKLFSKTIQKEETLFPLNHIF